MQKRCAPRALAPAASAITVSAAISLEALRPVSKCDRLAAIAAVLGAAAGLHREELRELHLGRIEDGAMNGHGAEHEFGQREIEQRLDLGPGPVVANADLRVGRGRHP